MTAACLSVNAVRRRRRRLALLYVLNPADGSAVLMIGSVHHGLQIVFLASSMGWVAALLLLLTYTPSIDLAAVMDSTCQVDRASST